MCPFRTREIVLPRFKLEQNYDLIGSLKKMGLTDMFQETADFTGMTSEKVSMNWVSNATSLKKIKGHLDTSLRAIGHSYCRKLRCRL